MSVCLQKSKKESQLCSTLHRLIMLLLIHIFGVLVVLVTATETTVTQQVSHRPTKCQSRW